MQEQKKTRFTKITQRKSTDNNKTRFQSIADMAGFLNKCCTEEKPDKQAVIYAIQYGVTVIGEIADQVKKSFQNTVPKRYCAMPWDNLIKLRQLTSHRFHQIDQELLLRAVDNDVIQIKIIANNLLVENEAAKLPPDDTIFKPLLEYCEEAKKTSEKKRRQKKQKTKKEPEEAVTEQKNRDVKYLNRILAELDNIEKFLKKDPVLKEYIMLNAVKMAIVIIGLSIEEHLSKEFKKQNPLNVEVKKNQPEKIIKLHWNKLVQIRQHFIHSHYAIEPQDCVETAKDILNIKQNIKTLLLKTQNNSTDLRTLNDSTTQTSNTDTEAEKIITKTSTLPANLEEIDVPSDGHCLFWSAALALLLPKLDQTEEFKTMYLRLFGKGEITLQGKSNSSQTVQIEADDTIEGVKNLLYTYDCQKEAPNQFQGGILTTLVTQIFRARVVSKLSEIIPEGDSRTAVLADRPTGTTWDQYLEYMRGNAFGGEPEINAISHLAQVGIETHSPNYVQPRNLSLVNAEIIYLIHVDNNHYHFGLANALYEKHTDNLGNKGEKHQLTSDAMEEKQEKLVSQPYSQSSLIAQFSPILNTRNTTTKQQENTDSSLHYSPQPE